MKEAHDIFKTWQDRWFVLNANTRTIHYYSEPTRTNLRGEYYNITNCQIVEPRGAEVDDRSAHPHPHIFEVIGESKHGRGKETLKLSASTEIVRNNWVDKIQRACRGEPIGDITSTTSSAFSEKLAFAEAEAEACCSACSIM